MAVIVKTKDKDVISRMREMKKEYHQQGICYTTGTLFEAVSDYDNYPDDLKPPHNGPKRCSICGYRLEKS
jgi:hypothetical protein